MKYIMLLSLILLSINGVTQSLADFNSFTHPSSKPSLDMSCLKNWVEMAYLQISNDGRYCGYIVEHKQLMERTVVLMGTKKKWRIESSIKGYYSISSESGKAAWINAHDSLCLATLGRVDMHYIPDVESFWIDNDYLSYQSKNASGRIFVINLKKHSTLARDSEKSTILIDDSYIKLVWRRDRDRSELFLKSRKGEEKIWGNGAISSLVKDDKQKQIAFVGGDTSKILYYYKLGTDTLIHLNVPLDSTFIFSGISYFSTDGKFLFLSLVERIPVLFPEKAVVNVWSYTDSKLQPQQLMEETARRYTGVIRLSDHQFFRLDSGNDWLFLPKIQDTIALIKQQMIATPADEINWNCNSQFYWYIISLKDGRRIELDSIQGNRIVQLSPSGKYVIYFDSKENNYFIYQTQSGYRRCLTKGLEENWLKQGNGVSYGQYIAAWGDDDTFVLLNGKRDIWQIDLTGQTPPINLTKGYGSKHNVIFFLALDGDTNRTIAKHETIILNAFNLDTKENGFYKTVVGGKQRLDSLSMGPCIYDIKDNPAIPSDINKTPIKALNAKKYIVRRMRPNEAPNFFFTADFKSFKPLSDIQPQKAYNWYTTELHEWKSLDSNMLQGVLYKPEDFDSTKRYPVIFHFYERRSDLLNAFLRPAVLDNGCEINIPDYVSNGYLVFSPDINYQIGNPMKGTYDAVISALRYIRDLSFVDSEKIGVQGCSWGGIQTNYIITRTNLFAAACSASGIANWVSEYGSIAGTGESMQGMFEIGQFRMNGTLWEKQETYIRNSPIFQVNAVTTPLLLMHTSKDMICSLSNIQNFFQLLYQARKKSWFLLYEGNHGVYGEDGRDFSLRMKQFFDYYLRGFPVPRWMTPSLPEKVEQK